MKSSEVLTHPLCFQCCCALLLLTWAVISRNKKTVCLICCFYFWYLVDLIRPPPQLETCKNVSCCFDLSSVWNLICHLKCLIIINIMYDWLRWERWDLNTKQLFLDGLFNMQCLVWNVTFFWRCVLFLKTSQIKCSSFYKLVWFHFHIIVSLGRKH